MLRKLFDHLTQMLRSFIQQRDNLLLLVPCSDSETALVLKALRDLDRQSSTELFLLFAEEFESADAFVSGLARQLQQEHGLANEMAKPDQKLPAPPAKLFDKQLTPWNRLEAGLAYGQSLVEPRRGQRFVWGMGTLTIKDPEAYLNLLAQIPPKPEILSWMRGARIVARVPADFKLESSPLAKAPRVAVEPFVIPPNAHEQELLAAAADPKSPLGERMQAEVQLAYIDYAHSRFEVATERFNKALAFFQWAGVPAMEGLIISGLGDIARRQGDLKKAQHWYSCAVVPAAEAGNPVLLANIVQNLAAVAFEEQRFAEAEERYTELVEFKRAMFDEDGLAEALEWKGVSQEKQKAYDRAVISWEEAALICKSFELKHRLDPILDRLKQGYQQLGLREELASFDAEWKA